MLQRIESVKSMLSLLFGVALPALQRRAHGNRREHHFSRRSSTIGRIHARRRSKDDDDGEGNDNGDRRQPPQIYVHFSLGCDVVVVPDTAPLAAGADPNGRCSEAEEEALGFIRQSERGDRQGHVDLCGCRPWPHRPPSPRTRRSVLLSHGSGGEPRSRSALSLALHGGHVAMAVFLIEHGAACDDVVEAEADVLGRLGEADRLRIREAIDSRVQLK